MKYQLILFVWNILVINITSAQIDKYEEIAKLQTITKDKMLNIMSESDCTFHLLYSYATWCKPCQETLPKVISIFSNRNNLKLYPLVIDKLSSLYMEDNINDIRDAGYQGIIYRPDPVYNSKAHRKVYEKFVLDLIPLQTDFGLSFFALFDYSGKLLYSSTYNIPSDKSISIIRNLIEKN